MVVELHSDDRFIMLATDCVTAGSRRRAISAGESPSIVEMLPLVGLFSRNDGRFPGRKQRRQCGVAAGGMGRPPTPLVATSVVAPVRTPRRTNGRSSWKALVGEQEDQDRQNTASGPDFPSSSDHEVSSKSTISPSPAPHISGWLPRTPFGLSPASESRVAHCPSGETLGVFRGKPRTRTTWVEQQNSESVARISTWEFESPVCWLGAWPPSTALIYKRRRSTAVALRRERWKESGSEAEAVGPAIVTLGGHALADAMFDFCDSTMNFTWDVDPLEAEETCDWVEMRAAS
ncbi:hypothetical protein CPLU01_12421 [Colletotrichum plurivorum]|uniref:Uncharacterized protein n=1 Tax=Colletotrichum plurivorum TaxID=2175906 RepID=A0A8H6JYQ5_9PEZI|nr:hypothetical protein CPLU01_12421 [Colletotrichum plurivorum]